MIRGEVLRSRVSVLFLAAAITVIAGPGTALAEDGPALKVGVVDVVHVNVNAEEAVEVSDALGRALAAELVVDVVAGAEARSRLGGDALPEGCVTQPECLKRIAAALGVEQVLALVIVRVGDRIRLEATWADAETGIPEVRPAIALNQGTERAHAIFADAAPGLLVDARPRPRPPGPVTPPGGDPAAGGTGVGVEAGGATSFGPIDQPGGRRMTTTTWIVGGVGVGLILGAGLAGGYYLADCGFERGCGDGHDNRYYLDAVAGVGVVALGAAAFLYFTSAPDEEEGAIGLGAGPGDVGVAVQGRF